MAKYYNQPASLNFDFSVSPPTTTETLISHTNDSNTLHNLLNADHFNAIEDAIIHIREAIWGVETTYNNLSDKPANTIMELIEELYSTSTANVTSQFFYQFIRYFTLQEGVFHTYGYNSIDHELNPDPLRNKMFDITVYQSSAQIEVGTYLKRNRLILPASDSFTISADNEMFGTYTGSVFIYLYSGYDSNSPATPGSIVVSTTPLNDDGDDWYIHLYTIKRILNGENYEFSTNTSDIFDYRTFIPEYIYELLYRTYNSEFEGIGNLPPLSTPIDTPIKLSYNNDNLYKFDLKYTSDFALDDEGNLIINSISPSLIASAMADIFDPTHFTQSIDDLWQMKLSSDFTVDGTGLKIASNSISKQHFVDNLFHHGLYFDPSNSLSLKLSAPFYILEADDSLSLNYNTSQFVITTGILNLVYNTSIFDTTSGLTIKNDSITLGMLKKGTGSSDIKVDSDGYAVFK